MNQTVMGISLHYEQEGEGEDVLLLHGWGCDAGTMRPLIDALKDGYRVTAIDFPAHGRTPEPDAPWSVRDFAVFLQEALKALRIERCHVFAHSFGARVAVMLATMSPGLFRRLILTGAAGIKKTRAPEDEKKLAAYKRKQKWLDMLAGLPFAAGFAKRLKDRLFLQHASPDYARLSPLMRQSFQKIVGEDLRPVYPMVSQETLLIFGESDTETPVWMAREMERLIPDCGLVLIPGGHFAFLSNLSRVALIVRHFFQTEEK